MGLSPLQALNACHQEPLIAFLDGGVTGPSLLALPDAVCLPHSQERKSLTEARRHGGTPKSPDCGSSDPFASWPHSPSLPGGILQLDYEFPVGPHALALPHNGSAGFFLPVSAYAIWSQGNFRLIGEGEAREKLERTLNSSPATLSRQSLDIAPIRSTWNQETYQQKVLAVKEHIATGDIYQANLACHFSTQIQGPTSADLILYQRLRRHSAAPYGAFLRLPGRSILSHSPECFLAWDAQRIQSRPIKGTILRIPGRDLQQRQALCASAKEQAELAMIVDLVRSDLGRIARPGSVKVLDPGRILDLEYVHHREAVIEALLQEGVSTHDILAAAFPAGSITGAPKIKAMEILRDLEAVPRGPWCGTFGWVGPNAGSLAVAIRTLVMDHDQNGNFQVSYHAGSGIVHDSDPAQEWAEVQAKASRLRAALEEGA